MFLELSFRVEFYFFFFLEFLVFQNVCVCVCMCLFTVYNNINNVMNLVSFFFLRRSCRHSKRKNGCKQTNKQTNPKTNPRQILLFYHVYWKQLLLCCCIQTNIILRIKAVFPFIIEKGFQSRIEFVDFLDQSNWFKE